MAGTQQFRKILLLGATGKLGRMMRALWDPDEYSVVPVVRSLSSDATGIAWSPGDAVPKIADVSAIVALWGVTPAPGCDLADNSRLAQAAMSLGAEVGAEAVVHCSSAAVYRPGPEPLSETMTPGPCSPYGQAKLDMEQTIAAHQGFGGPRQIILRIGNVAGADSLFANLRKAHRVILDRFEDGQGPERSYLAPRDLARVIEEMLRDPGAEGVINVSAPRPTPMAEIARACGASIEWRKAPATAQRQVWLDTSRLDRVLSLSAEAALPEYLVNSARDSGVWP